MLRVSDVSRVITFFFSKIKQGYICSTVDSEFWLFYLFVIVLLNIFIIIFFFFDITKIVNIQLIDFIVILSLFSAIWIASVCDFELIVKHTSYLHFIFLYIKVVQGF
jgi:hypothetical protein